MNEYEMVWAVGCCLAAIWVVLHILSWIGSGCWAWVDRKEEWSTWLPFKKFLVRTTERKFKHQWELNADKLSHHGEVYKYVNLFSDGRVYLASNDESDAFERRNEKDEYSAMAGLAAIALLILPFTLLCMFKVYPVVIGVVTFALIAMLTRYARDHKKVFDEHVADNEAHKG